MVESFRRREEDLKLARQSQSNGAPSHGRYLGSEVVPSDIHLIPKVQTQQEPRKTGNSALHYLNPPPIPTRSALRVCQPSAPVFPGLDHRLLASVENSAPEAETNQDGERKGDGHRIEGDKHGIKDREGTPYLWNQFHRTFGPADHDPFVARSFLGQGTMGTVEEVAVSNAATVTYVRKKVLLPRYLRKKNLMIVQQEVAILRSLAHHHIVRLLGTYEDQIQLNRPSSYCLIMSPVGDGDLKDFLHQSHGRYDEARIVGRPWLQQWLICLSSALHYMHSQGVRHQDIKPSNIVHCGDRVFFTDFSSSTRFDIGHTTSTENPARASAMYAAPEVSNTLSEEGTYQRHGLGSDIFALGCVFCEILTVLVDEEVSTFHGYLLEHDSSNTLNGGPLVYNQKLQSIEEWFARFQTGRDWATKASETLPLYYPYDIFMCCIKPMIAELRESRCNTAAVLLNLESSRRFGLLASSCPCCKQSP